MSSILTNTSAMVALQTMKSINSNLNQVQNEISTGKSVSNAKDNAAVWAISKTMESDVKGFSGISDSLDLASSALGVARDASESVQTLLTDIKTNIVAAQEDTADKGKLQTAIENAVNQIKSITSAAQFNGLNLIKGTEEMSVLSSLDRDSSGNVTASKINVARADLTTTAGTYGSGTSLTANAVVSDTAANALDNVGNTAVVTMATAADYSTAATSFTIAGTSFSFAAGELSGDQDAAAATIAGRINALGIEGVTASVSGADISISSTRAFEGVAVSVDAASGAAIGSQITEVNGAATTASSATIDERALNVTFDKAASVAEGDGYRVSFGGEQFTYVAGPDESMEDVARGLKTAIDSKKIDGVTTSVTQADDGSWQLKVDNNSATAKTLVAVGASGGEASGGLFGLDQIDVSTKEGAAAALSNIENMINTAIDAASSFGASQTRIETQTDFVSKLTDALTTGIGTMVDADMEEASARLQALQVQQQLGVQALSIANQAPQTILSLFK
ncbi:MAG: flagellin [Paracoccaceae bacterium]